MSVGSKGEAGWISFPHPPQNEKMEHQDKNKTGLNWRWGVALTIFVLAIGFFLFSEHRAHLFGFLPYPLLLGCLFMHFFMHGGHGGKSHGRE